jgi:hypothetical protein
MLLKPPKIYSFVLVDAKPVYALGYGEVPEIMLLGPSQVLNFRASVTTQQRSRTRQTLNLTRIAPGLNLLSHYVVAP